MPMLSLWAKSFPALKDGVGVFIKMFLDNHKVV